MRMCTLNKIKNAVATEPPKHIQQIYSTTTQPQSCSSKHKYWSKVSKRTKLHLLMDYIHRTYADNPKRNEYSFKITTLLNNGDLNTDDCIDFDYIHNSITKLNFSLDTLTIN